MPTDHLDKDTAISFDLTESGIKASAKSRTIAAIDRLGGALVDSLNAFVEGGTAKRRAKTEGEVALIESIVAYGVSELKADPKQAERAFRQHFKKVIAAQENRDAILSNAVEDLKHSPPIDEIPGQISEGFYTRFEQYADTASTSELRTLFGSILAGEIRKPGTVSPATMHLASMLDSNTAHLIDQILPFATRHGQVYLAAMPTPLTVPELAHLEMTGFFSTGKTHKMIIGEEGFALRHIGEGVGLIIDGPPNHVIDIEIAILSTAGNALAEVLSPAFDVQAFTVFALKMGATGCRVGRWEISGNNVRVFGAKNVMIL